MIQVDLSPLHEASALVELLIEDKWTLVDDDFTVSATVVSTAPSETLRALDPIKDAIVSARAESLIGSQTFRLERTFNGTLEVVSVPSFSASEFASGANLAIAENAWEGSVESAEALGLTWTFLARMDLSRLVKAVGMSLKVCLDTSSIEEAFEEAARSGPIALNRLVPSVGRRVYASLRGGADQLDSGAVSCLSLPLVGSVVELDERVENLPGEGKSSEKLPLASPTALTPRTETSDWPRVRESLSRGAAMSTWIQIANEVDWPEVTYFGFKSVSFTLPDTNSWTQESIEATARLHAWAFSEPSPDRLLALRQVISLYEGDGPFRFADEVRDGAEPIYNGLRSEAVAEVVRSTRDAQAHAMEVVRQALASTQSVLKSTVERSIAGAVAAAAAVIANVSASVPAEITNWLLAGVGAYFVILLAIFLVVESPSLMLPLEVLDDDLRRGVGLLTSERRMEFVQSQGVVATQRRVKVARVSVVIIYSLAIGLITIVVLHRMSVP